MYFQLAEYIFKIALNLKNVILNLILKSFSISDRTPPNSDGSTLTQSAVALTLLLYAVSPRPFILNESEL